MVLKGLCRGMEVRGRAIDMRCARITFRRGVDPQGQLPTEKRNRFPPPGKGEGASKGEKGAVKGAHRGFRTATGNGPWANHTGSKTE